MTIRISIDGACRRNGKPDCVASGGVFIAWYSTDGEMQLGTTSIAVSEKGSTNQRGEMLALLEALKYLNALDNNAPTEVQIITDSEYLFNTMTKRWFDSWQANNWIGATGARVKNSDIWERIVDAYEACSRYDIVFYHIKGHCISFGKVTAGNWLDFDPSGKRLYLEACKKFDAQAPTKQIEFEAAQALSEKNNGFRLPAEIFKDFVVSNTVVDAVATKEVEEADREI